MTSISFKGSASSVPHIPQEVLRKAAESALVSSFIELNACKNSTNIKSSSSLSSSSSTAKRSISHKVVIDLDTKDSSATSSSNTENTSVFIKVTPRSSPYFAHALRESKIYEEFLKELLQSKCKRKVNPLDFVPTCFLTQVNEEHSMIFLENLKAQGFVQQETLTFLDFNHALLAVETLARLHSASYFARRQLGSKGKGTLEILQKFPYLKQVKDRNDAKQALIYAQFFDQIICKMVEADNPSLAFKLRRKLREPSLIYDKMEQLLENEKYENDDFYVACHGDYRTGNLMYNYPNGQVLSEPSECRMVDLKSLKWAPIASDLAYFFLTSTTGKMREEFEEKLLAFYCDTFEEHLKSRYEAQGLAIKDFDIEDFHRKLENQYRRMLEYGFYKVIVVLPLLMAESVTSLDVDEIVTNHSEFEKFVHECTGNSVLEQNIVSIVKQLVKNRVI
jgi:thiamine kinase-like enzyme